MNSLLLTVKRSVKLSDGLYYKLRSSSSKSPQFCGLPKVHKPGRPLRTIVGSFIDSLSYQLSKHLVSLLSPIVGSTTSHVEILINYHRTILSFERKLV